MPDGEWVEIEIDGQTIEFYLWPSGTEYDIEPSDVTEVNIWSCIGALEKHSKSIEGAIKPGEAGSVDLTLKLGEERFPWEKNLFCLIIHCNDTERYVAEFSLNTAT